MRPAKLTDQALQEIRAKWRARATRKSLAKDYGVSESTIGRVVTGDYRKNVPRGIDTF